MTMTSSHFRTLTLAYMDMSFRMISRAWFRVLPLAMISLKASKTYFFCPKFLAFSKLPSRIARNRFSMMTLPKITRIKK